MIHDFTFYNPTKIQFGKDSLNMLSGKLENYSKNSIKI